MSSYDQAIVKTGGKQYRVVPGAVLRVEKLEGEVGTKLELDEVLLAGIGRDVVLGTPWVKDGKVTATIKGHGRGPKLIVYKFRRRKNYRRKAGHRQSYTEIKIESINA